jgi:uncharacterized protein YdeI (YjbR/CyaY-like superfamily)
MKKSRTASDALPTLAFPTSRAWAEWLDVYHGDSTGVWLRLAKKGCSFELISHREALEEALCYGWIDGQLKPESATTWLVKFTPRRNRSIWSKINREKAVVLIESGRMKPAGLREVERARADGRWEAAYDSFGKATVPVDLQAVLDRNARAKAFFATLDRANRYAVLWRIQTAKRPETRARRIREFVAMLARHEKLHP